MTHSPSFSLSDSPSMVSSVDTLPTVFLNKGAEKRLLHGHRWIYSNEVNTTRGDYAQLAEGACASVLAHGGQALGSAYFNRHSLLCGRLYSTEKNCALSGLLNQRILAAIAYRDNVYREPFYRAVFGDGDDLSGLVVDRYGDCWVLQLTTAGMYALLDTIVSVLVENFSPRAIVLHNDSVKTDEAVEKNVKLLWGELPAQVEIVENNTRFIVPVFDGQKTGWFYDHRESRVRLAQICQGKRVLDVYSYLGAWGLTALKHGAASLHAVDRSAAAIACLQENVALNSLADNNLAERCTVSVGEADQVLKSLLAQGEQYDVVIVDPPAFIQRRKDMQNGVKAYHRINQLAVKLLAKDGVLASCSCSMHLSSEKLASVVATAAYKQRRSARLIYQGGLGLDHPVLATMPELNYLKTFFAKLD